VVVFERGEKDEKELLNLTA